MILIASNPFESEDRLGQHVCGRIRAAMAKSCYPLRSIRCDCDTEVLRLCGTVSRYFYLQMAIEIARRYAIDQRIELQIKVETRPDA